MRRARSDLIGFTLRGEWEKRIYAGFIMGYESYSSLFALFREMLLNLRIRVPQQSSARARSGTCTRKQEHCSLFNDEFLLCVVIPL